MFPFFETIAIENGIILNPTGHQQRYERTLRHFYGSAQRAINIADIAIPTIWQKGLVRCRMNYNNKAQEIIFSPYHKRKILSFQPIVADSIHYDFKFTERGELQQLFTQRGEKDEIIIIKNHLLTDCSIGNLVLRKNGQWFTPEKPLLFGTQREKLIQENKIIPCPIYFHDLDTFETIRVINALNPLEEI